MRSRLNRLWSWDATLNRGPYLFVGVGLLLLKHLLDYSVAAGIFGLAWQPFHYFVLPVKTVGLLGMSPEERVFSLVLLVLAVPFIYVGVVLTIQRLRSADLPIWLVIFFFLPLVNLLFFVILCALPGKLEPLPSIAAETTSGQQLTAPLGGRAFQDVGMEYRRSESWQRLRSAHQRVTRDSSLGSAFVSLVFSVPLALGSVFLATQGLGNYGWGLFVGMPFCLGLFSVVLFGLAKPQPFSACMGVAHLALFLAGLGIFAVAMEGAICLIMALPIAWFLVVLGALVGFAIQSRPWSSQDNPSVLLLLVFLLPSQMAAEAVNAPEPPLLEVTSVVEIDAGPEVVWNKVIAFPELPPPDEWLFHTGIAYPLRAEINGHGVGSVRHCIFTTGAFVEPIEVWDAPYLLRFRVEEQPCPMTEWSPFNIHPPHLDHYLVSKQGQFRLTPLADGRTRLEGTTWYSNRMWPAWYWRMWSDTIIHRIHLRVLRHIKTLAEPAAGVPLRGGGTTEDFGK
jgi:hypothetical protein